MMNELIVQQQVNRRKPSSAMVQNKPQKPGASNLSGHSVPLGHTTNVITQIKQNPVPIPRDYKKKDSFSPPILSFSRIILPTAFTQAEKKQAASPQKPLIFTRISIII
jgi:hypothetical protein